MWGIFVKAADMIAKARDINVKVADMIVKARNLSNKLYCFALTLFLRQLSQLRLHRLAVGDCSSFAAKLTSNLIMASGPC